MFDEHLSRGYVQRKHPQDKTTVAQAWGSRRFLYLFQKSFSLIGEYSEGNQVVHFSAIFLKEHRWGWQTFRLASGRFSGSPPI